LREIIDPFAAQLSVHELHVRKFWVDFDIICYLEPTVNKPFGEADFGRTNTYNYVARTNKMNNF